ncbi:unnamed protein product [Urochloa humidicola]
MEKDGVDEATTQQMDPSAAHADDQDTAVAVDLLSGLCDDVLVHILGLAKHARDAVRTGALSRRWRGLWRRAPTLRFILRRWIEHGGSIHGFIAFVDDTLALHVRSSDGGGSLEQLVIIFDMWSVAWHNVQQLVPPSTAAVERWIHYTMRHGVKSLHIEIYMPEEREGGITEETPPVLALGGLPSSAKLEAMYLDLADAWVRLPATVAFASLTDLTLESIKVAGDNVQLLARLVSSACCPDLHKLRMCDITLAPQQKLLVEAGVLTELWLDDMAGMTSLELRTPSLRVLCIRYCHDLESFTALVPRLEKLRCQRNRSLTINQDFPFVSSLKLDLYSHRHADGNHNIYGNINHSIYGNICLLQRCDSASCLSVDLYIPTVCA